VGEEASLEPRVSAAPPSFRLVFTACFINPEHPQMKHFKGWKRLAKTKAERKRDKLVRQNEQLLHPPFDPRTLAGFIPVERYGDKNANIHIDEIGMCEGVRYYRSAL
jgi:hypothetical protein